MEKNNGRKWTVAAFMFVFVSIVGLTVAFANLSQDLDISPEIAVKGSTWKVEFDDFKIVEKSNNVVVTGPTVVLTSITGLKVDLKTPGDTVSFTFDVINKGDINAKIGLIDIIEPVCQAAPGSQTAEADEELVCGNVSYSLVYTDGEGIPKKDDTLSRNGIGDYKRNMTLTITYADGEDIPKNDVTLSGLKVAITYVQD